MGVKIYPSSARIPVKIGDVVFKMSPMTQDQRMELAEFAVFDGGQYVQKAARMTFRAIKFSVKEVHGLDDALTGQPYQLKFDSNGVISDECVNELLSTELNEKLVLSCMNFVKGIPSEITDHRTGEKVEGVDILPAESALKKNSSDTPLPLSPTPSPTP